MLQHSCQWLQHRRRVCFLILNAICDTPKTNEADFLTLCWFSSFSRLVFSAILGALCYILFIAFRTKFRLYFARLDMPQVSLKPPEMRTDGHYRWWSWLIPVFTVSDDELLESAGLDALVCCFLGYSICMYKKIKGILKGKRRHADILNIHVRVGGNENSFFWDLVIPTNHHTCHGDTNTNKLHGWLLSERSSGG